MDTRGRAARPDGIDPLSRIGPAPGTTPPASGNIPDGRRAAPPVACRAAALLVTNDDPRRRVGPSPSEPHTELFRRPPLSPAQMEDFRLVARAEGSSSSGQMLLFRRAETVPRRPPPGSAGPNSFMSSSVSSVIVDSKDCSCAFILCNSKSNPSRVYFTLYTSSTFSSSVRVKEVRASSLALKSRKLPETSSTSVPILSTICFISSFASPSRVVWAVCMAIIR
mmetsp:Transcript_80682/g.215367  ORF Transcript_80682/g.215367 Transcript_80682/m.215367 type:complete len:223 (+) Transcript_80682:211-879(+)